MAKKPVLKVRGGEKVSVKKPEFVGKRKALPPAKTKKCLYVLDTNVFMHDPSCLFRFQEHDIFITSTVLEELDNHKKGHDEINRNVREAFRTLEKILFGKVNNISEGVPLSVVSGGIASGCLFLQTEIVPAAEGLEKADNQILATVTHLVAKNKNVREVVLVSKDTGMRIKAKAAKISVQDYHNDMVIEDTGRLYAGTFELPADFWEKNTNLTSWKEGHLTFYKVSGPFSKKLSLNQFVYTSTGKQLCARVIEKDGNTVVLQTVTDHNHEKHSVSGIVARNMEQNFALNLLLDPNVDLVTLVGKAGSGKTLLTLAAAIKQTVDENLYHEIIFTRVTIPVGEDIGFLPGGEEEKMSPWMGALEDNLDVLRDASLAHSPSSKKFEKGSLSTLQNTKDLERRERKDLISSRIKIKSLSFMRGRTFLNKIVIIDEVQNLTAKQVKMLITRAGPGTKIVCLGNLEQIDTPYLTEGSSGLTYLVDRFKGWDFGGHVTLIAGERSRLATQANKVL